MKAPTSTSNIRGLERTTLLHWIASVAVLSSAPSCVDVDSIDEDTSDPSDPGTDDTIEIPPDDLGIPVSETATMWITDTTAESTRTIPAYLDPQDPDRVINVFEIRYPAIEGEKRLVAAKILARQPSRTPDSLLMAAVTLACYPSGYPRSSIGATQNTLRGHTATLTPRLVYTAPRTGTVVCRVAAVGRRPRPSSGATSHNVWLVDVGSSISASAPLTAWSRYLVSEARSRVLDAGEQWTPVIESVHVDPFAGAFTLISDHKVTTCTSVGGSRDGTTNGLDLCVGRVGSAASDGELTVKARQRTISGDWCGESQTAVSQSFRIDRDVHHGMLFSAGTVHVDPSCASTFVITSTLRLRSGTDLMVHGGSVSTSIVSH
jgi:hypothetical protein